MDFSLPPLRFAVSCLLVLGAFGALAPNISSFGRSKLDERIPAPIGPGGGDTTGADALDVGSLRTLHGFQANWKALGARDDGADGYSWNEAADAPDLTTFGNPGPDGSKITLTVAGDTFDNGGGAFMKTKAFEPDARLNANGLGVELKFVAEQDECAPGLTQQVQVLLVQESTGAIATSIWTAGCGSPSKAVVVVHAVKASGRFEPGTATACAVRLIRQNGQLIETFHWCRDVELK